jgi:hypothetical protein
MRRLDRLAQAMRALLSDIVMSALYQRPARSWRLLGGGQAHLDRSSCTMRSRPDDRAACCAIVDAFNWGARQPEVSSGGCPWKDRRDRGLGAMREVASDSDSSNSSRPDVKSAVPAPQLARPTKPKPRLSASSPSALLGEPVTMSRSTKVVESYANTASVQFPCIYNSKVFV